MSKVIPKIEQWSVVRRDFRAPETGGQSISGKIYGHPEQPDGRHVTTSPMVRVNGHRIETESGSLYLLGEPSREYLEWLRSEGIPFDPKQPIVVKRARGS